ncbi:MAG: c-type cytochrome [Anaerolineae bacterium]
MKNHRNLWTLFLLVAAALLLAACSTPQAEAEHSADETDTAVEHENDHADEHGDKEAADGDMMEHADGEMDMEHATSMMEHEHAEAPDDFADLTNPFAEDEKAVAAGKEIFTTNCVPCHGETGQGDGVAAVGLDPKPANLADGTMMNMLSDAYLFWRVSKGGIVEPFNSAMPAWESNLTEEQRWQVISYVRTLAGDGSMDMDHMDGEHADGEEHSD